MALPCFFVMITMIIGLLAAFPAVSCAATSGNCGENGDVSAAEPVYVGFMITGEGSKTFAYLQRKLLMQTKLN